MEQVLRNMANHSLIEYCREQGIDCSGTYCTKDGRGFSYVLNIDPSVRKDIDPRWPSIARITFHKNAVPTFGF